MELIAPPGYAAVVPFRRDRHRGLGRAPARAADFAAALGAVYLTAAELFAASRDYPIVFVPTVDERFVPMAVTGLDPSHNLWLESDGRWAEGRYVPAYIRRFPFCIAQVEGSDRGPLICVEEGGLAAGDVPYMDADGQPTEPWRVMETLINEMEAARRATEALCAVLVEHELLARFEMQAQPKGGAERRLTNIYRVDEKRLNRLAPKKIKALMEAGQLARIYAHLMSLDNFARLLDRHQAVAVD